ncbi:GTPase Der [Clostridia bacterium]|nr:GTPase Der [Clostridia bacterium]
MHKPVVAIVGRPNVGKSALFNKLLGKRVSIVEDSYGVTRDRIYGECEWQNRKFSLIDTGGVVLDLKNDDIIPQVRIQAEFAINSSDVVVMVTDVKTGILPSDEEVCNLLKKHGKPIILCVNKCDNVGGVHLNFYEFFSLGIKKVIAISSIHGHGTGDLLEAIFEYFDKNSVNDTSAEQEFANVAIIGKPNVGKSSLVNRILGYTGSIVSSVAGTTRDAIDTKISNKFGNFNLIDTAGIRRKSKICNSIEKFSVMRSKYAIERSDLCVILIDAEVGVTEQDAKIAGLAHEAGKACVLAVNKWDLIEKDNNAVLKHTKKIEEYFSFMSYAPVVFISASTGHKVRKLFQHIVIALYSHSMRISTGTLNEILMQAVLKVPPPAHKGKQLKIYYMTQVSVKPPTFVVFINKLELFHLSYQRYLENCIRKVFPLIGTRFLFVIREKNSKQN